jgi:HSP20 family protein
MSSTRWDPWSEFVSLREAMNNLLEESFVSRPRPGEGDPAGGQTRAAATQTTASGLAVDIRESADGYEVTASVPGVSPDQVEITVLGDRLRIRGERRDDAEQRDPGGRWILRERRFGAFERSVTLPSAVKADAASADFKDGVLTITLPKADEARPRSIPVRPGISNVLPGAAGELEGQVRPATTDLSPRGQKGSGSDASGGASAASDPGPSRGASGSAAGDGV